MIKAFVYTLTIFCTIGITGCDLSMNKNKNKTTAKEDVSKKPLAQTPLEEQQPIHIDDITPKVSSQTKQAESWQEMNLATSSNDQGNHIQFDNNSEPERNTSQSNTPDQKIEDYFPDYKPQQ